MLSADLLPLTNKLPFRKAAQAMFFIPKQVELAAPLAVVDLGKPWTMQTGGCPQTIRWMYSLGAELEEIVGPALVVEVEGRLLIHDGNNRLTTRRLQGWKQVKVRLLQGYELPGPELVAKLREQQVRDRVRLGELAGRISLALSSSGERNG